MREYDSLYDLARRLSADNEIMKECLNKTKCYLEMSKQYCDYPGTSFSLVDKERYQLEKAIQDFGKYDAFIKEYIDFLQQLAKKVLLFEEEAMRVISEIPEI